MEFECIIYEKDEQIAVIKLNRPKVLNAMNKQLPAHGKRWGKP